MRLRGFLCALALGGALRAQDGDDIEVSVRVVGPTGLPLPGVQIGRATPEEPLGRTDATGTLRVRAQRGEKIRVLDDVFASEGLIFLPEGLVPVPIPSAKVTGEEIVLQCRVGVAGQIAFVDAETGAEIRGARWSTKHESRTIEQGIVLTGPGGDGTINVTPPAGYRLWEHDVGAHMYGETSATRGEIRLGTMSYFARSVSAVVPLRKAVEIEIAVKDQKGRPVRGFTVASVKVGGIVSEDSRSWDEKLAPGRVRLVVPHFREGCVSVHLRKDGFWGSHAVATWTTRLGWDYKAKLSGTVQLEPSDPEPEQGQSSIGIAPRNPPPADRVGQLVIRARRYDGSPAHGIPVTLEYWEKPGGDVMSSLDGQGQASFDALPTGRWVVDLHAAGFLGRRCFVDIGEDLLEFDYDEPVGGSLEVTVVDKKRRPLPFAALSLSHPKNESWRGISWEIDGSDCQRVDMFTDHGGRRKLVRLPPGKLRVHARYGARAGAEIVTVASGDAGELEIALADEP